MRRKLLGSLFLVIHVVFHAFWRFFACRQFIVTPFFLKKIPSPNAVKRPEKGIYMVKKIKIFQFKWISKLLAKPSVSK